MMSGRASPAISDAPLLQRLIGLETEYATMIHPPPGRDPDSLPARGEVYEAIRQAIARRQPTAQGCFDARKLFLASGGAITAESSPVDDALAGGLIEGATPEVRSPQTLLVCQRAQDRMLQQAADSCDLDAEVRILKNSSDRLERIYGCQENYEAEVARGAALWLLRTGLVLLLPLQLLYWLCVHLVVYGSVLLLGAARIGTAVLRGRLPRMSQLMQPPPAWGLTAVVAMVRGLRMPVVGWLLILTRLFAFRRQRTYLTAFLVSRLVLTGSGHVDGRGKYWLSAKAMAIDLHVGLGGYRGERPIYVFRHWLERLCEPSPWGWMAVLDLMRRRQRLQIGLSDSNIADTAEYLKVATTSLVLDMLEAGWGDGLPVLRKPIASLHRIAGDWNLVSRVPTSGGAMSGLEIQQCFLSACRRFVAAQKEPPPAEVAVVLERWEETLDAAMAFRNRAEDMQPSIGKIDWLTKRWMLDQLSPSAPWAVRKKVDLRYHELSEESYFERLSSAIPTMILTNEDSIERAGRMPPNDTPAGRRGHLIREFSVGDQPIRASWSHVVIGQGRRRRVLPTSE